MAVRPRNRSSGRVVRALPNRYLWVSREGDEPRSEHAIVTNHVVLPCATINKGWPAHQDTPTTSECTRNVRERLPPNDLGTVLIEYQPIQ